MPGQRGLATCKTQGWERSSLLKCLVNRFRNVAHCYLNCGRDVGPNGQPVPEGFPEFRDFCDVHPGSEYKLRRQGKGRDGLRGIGFQPMRF